MVEVVDTHVVKALGVAVTVEDATVVDLESVVVCEEEDELDTDDHAEEVRVDGVQLLLLDADVGAKVSTELAAGVEPDTDGSPALPEQIPASTRFCNHAPASNSL